MSIEAVDLLTTKEAADRAGVHPRTINRWTRSGRLSPARKLPGIRGAYLYSPVEVDAASDDSQDSAA